MKTVIFYEKPGCANNARQRNLLVSAGHKLIVRNLLAESWTRERLLDFLRERPVREWINPAAPRVKSGEIVPEQLDADRALALMLEDPLFIRRPLLEANGRREVGFDRDRIHAWLGLTDAEDNLDAKNCTRTAPCPTPESR